MIYSRSINLMVYSCANLTEDRAKLHSLWRWMSVVAVRDEAMETTATFPEVIQVYFDTVNRKNFEETAALFVEEGSWCLCLIRRLWGEGRSQRIGSGHGQGRCCRRAF